MTPYQILVFVILCLGSLQIQVTDCVKYEVVEDEGWEPYIELPIDELMKAEGLILIDDKKKKQPIPTKIPDVKPPSILQKLVPAKPKEPAKAPAAKPAANSPTTTKAPAKPANPPAPAKTPAPAQPKPPADPPKAQESLVLQPDMPNKDAKVQVKMPTMKIWRDDLRRKKMK